MVLYPVTFKDADPPGNVGTLLSNAMDAIQKARQATTKPDSIATSAGC